MVDEELLHEIAYDVIAQGQFPRVSEEEFEAATAFAKSSEWAPEPGTDDIPGLDRVMQNPQMYVGYGILLGLEAARRSL